ncbi:hypothetical protein PL75_11155 [Neisseria arctica]|uniref:Uncharacterized protein n=1 Tax=Neisseria arctica TaxID=1470200 RepID=A0A0J0YP42_9NEIS|nr:hypothetical protein PL75_11155 [Neisseria arctica]
MTVCSNNNVKQLIESMAAKRKSKQLAMKRLKLKPQNSNNAWPMAQHIAIYSKERWQFATRIRDG